MMSSEDREAVTDVLIAGAGPTGLMLALWLARLGVKVRVVDTKPGPTTESRALAVQARTLEFYDQLGIGAEAVARGRHAAGLCVWTGGQVRASMDLRGLGAALSPHPDILILTQDENEGLLLRELQARGGSVEWNTQLRGFTQDARGITARVERGGRSESVRAGYLAGCDGASSAVRHGLGVALSGGTYPQRFYVADVTASGALHAEAVNVSLDRDQFVAFFPMLGAGRYRLVGQVPAGAEEAVSFETVRARVEAQGIATVEAVHWFSTYRVHHRVAETFQDRRVFLLGDAAHVHSPVGGQGMNTGLGDASNLAWKLAQALRGRPEALASYGPERRPFAVTLVRTTDQVFSGMVRASPLARLVRTRVMPRVIDVVSRARWVRRLAFLTMSQLRIHYPDSALSVGRAGKVRGGDRLPWVAMEGGSNFATLSSLRWQVHVYGAASPELRAWCEGRTLPVHVFAFDERAREAGFAQDAVYLVRPDGHVGLALPRFDLQEAEAYAARWLPA